MRLARRAVRAILGFALVVLPALAGAVPEALAAPAPSRASSRVASVVRPTPEDLAGLSSASDLSISPDGARLVYTLATARLDLEAQPSDSDPEGGWKRDRQIWIVDLASGEPVQLTRGLDQARYPVWSPDGGEIAFVRKAKGKNALHVIAVDGGEANVVATGDLEPSQVKWAPDGKSFAFVAATGDSKAKRDAKWKSGGAIDWGREFASELLWVVTRGGGEPRRVMRGGEHVVAYDWSPDGTRFVVTTSPSSDPYDASGLQKPRIVSAKDGATLVMLPGEPSDYASPRWSPDGKRVAFLTLHESLSMLNELRVYEAAPGGKYWNALPDHERAMSSFVWAPDSRSLIALERHRTGSQIQRFPVGGGAGVELGLAGRVADAPLTMDRAGTKLAFNSSTDREPRDPTIFALDTQEAKIVTRLNPEVAKWNLGREEVVRWKGEGGIDLEGLLLVSPAAKPNAPAPLLVMPHGGPDDVSAQSFGGLSQYFAAHGISVFRPNYRGGFGYGWDFYAANRGRLGEIEFQDIESGVDALIAAKKADARRLVYGGWSWGGYLTTWTIAHTNRYRAAVVGAGVNDVFVQYSVSDINHGVAAQWEYRGDPWRQLEHFDRANPIRLARNIQTPTLLFHGQNDARVGFVTSQELHRALLDLGVPTRFWAYPREPHNPQEPAHQAHRARAWLEWYQTYLK